jgi:hypothetical protein
MSLQSIGFVGWVLTIRFEKTPPLRGEQFSQAIYGRGDDLIIATSLFGRAVAILSIRSAVHPGLRANRK